ncbi:MAG: 3-isopropylmalate dehydratase small subunit [Candidatus Omnitrophica bacterium]|nr:3-isopropylmalate dehydratase small subunit [Candidatus Omnitrophota bacterium]MBU1853825.1 3-isopropylmalate dehydratase small subunit [Candidatus Omnitrophota bacterium]
MKFKGKVWKFGDNINTDEIIPARFLNTQDPQELGAHCMEDIDAGFSKKVSKGDIIVAGKNFGCGSSREHAQIAIKASGVSCVIAESFARIFYRNSINMGLPIIEIDDISQIKEGDYLEVELDKGEVLNLSEDKHYNVQVFPKFIQDIIKKGGLLKWVRRKRGKG